MGGSTSARDMMARELRRVVLLRRVGLFARRESAIARDSESSRIQNRHADRQLLQDAEMSSLPVGAVLPRSTCPPRRNHQRGVQIHIEGGERGERPHVPPCGEPAMRVMQRRTGDHRRRSEPEQEGESQDRGLFLRARKVVTSADSPSLGHAPCGGPRPLISQTEPDFFLTTRHVPVEACRLNALDASLPHQSPRTFVANRRGPC